MNNTVIKVKNKEHGKKVIEWFKSKGIDTGFFSGNVSEEDGQEYVYYGVVDNIFSNLSHKEVMRHNANIIELPQEEIPTLGNGILMEVSYDPEFKRSYKRFVIGKLDKGYLCWSFTEKEGDIDSRPTTWFPYARPIQEPVIPEYTMEELITKLGHDFKIKK